MDAVLNQHIELIVKALNNSFIDINSIVLYGGYGRGEGSWIFEENGNCKPYNDYDILIVKENKIPKEKIEFLCKELAKQIGIRWIDISQTTSTELLKIRPSIYSYDLKYASRVIYGDSSVLDLIPEMDPTKLPLKEVEILFFTRLWTLLGSIDKKGFSVNLQGDASRFFRNQMAKSILSVVDVLLLAQGAYDSSYRKRVEIVAGLYPEKDDLLKLSQWALAEKLRPQAPIMLPEEILELYRMVHSLYFNEMYRGLGIYFRKTIRNPKDIEYCMKWLPKMMLKRLWWIVRFRSFCNGRQVSLKLAQTYIAAAWNPYGINEKYLMRGISILCRIDRYVRNQMTWDEARIEAARLRMSV